MLGPSLTSRLLRLPGLHTVVVLAAAWLFAGTRIAPRAPLALIACALITLAHLGYASVRGPARAGVLALASMVPLAVGADMSLDQLTAASDLMAVPTAFVVGTAGYLLALLGMAAAPHLLASAPVRLRLAISRLAALLAIVACSSVVGLAVQKLRSHDDPDAWRARTMDLGLLGRHGISGTIVPPPPCRYLGEPATRTCPPSVRGALEDGSDDGVSALPDAIHTCRIDVSDETGRTQTLTLAGVPHARRCSSFALRRVAGTMWIAIPVTHDDGASLHAFVDPEDADRPFVSLGGLAPWIAPPLSWCLAGLVGVLAAIGLLLVPRDRLLRDRLCWREEMRDGVAILVNPHAPPETYRSALDVSDVRWAVPGTRATALLAWQRLRAGRWVFAGATALVFATPVLVAAARGLLG